MKTEKHVGFRAWFYFRNGWSMYFAFMLAAINTLTVTYYLAIEKLPILSTIFPSFFVYIAVTTTIGVPLLIVVGFVHYKRTGGHRAEVDVGVETNPYLCRQFANTELVLNLQLKLIEILLKLSKNEKLTDDEIKDMTELKNKIIKHTEERTFKNKLDLKFIKEEMVHK